MDKFLITGASSGIGRELALRLAARGAKLVLSGRSEGKLSEVAAACTGATAVETVASDITSPGAAEALVAKACESMGGIDCVIHCAGIGLIKPAAETTDAEFSKVVNTNLRGTFLVAREACKAMAAQKHGLFITLPGILGKAVMKNAAAYIASKFGVTGLIKTFAQEYARSGVRFCLFFLGGVDSPFWDGINMAVQRDKMIPLPTAADLIMQAIDAPPHLVLAEVVLQPESHQLV
ncbi:MAG: SDR family oxidoreductase [Chthoniobacterales bacterium]|nr:SDR family oxidoreductase [Chthoniobacterales bacterium]